MKGEKERQGDFVFTANDVGEYRFCFNNEMSTFAEKTVDFEIAVRTSYFHLIHIDLIPSSNFLLHHYSILPPLSSIDADQPDS